MVKQESNAVKYPEAWAFYIEQARNITNEPNMKHLGNYRIPVPDRSGNFIYAGTVEGLWSQFITAWYKISFTSPSVYGKIQYIVQNFRG